MTGEPPRREPTAAARQLAAAFYDQYLALTQEGFKPAEALQLIAAMVAASTPKPEQP